jgi:hypothetical protein
MTEQVEQWLGMSKVHQHHMTKVRLQGAKSQVLQIVLSYL